MVIGEKYLINCYGFNYVVIVTEIKSGDVCGHYSTDKGKNFTKYPGGFEFTQIESISPMWDEID